MPLAFHNIHNRGIVIIFVKRLHVLALIWEALENIKNKYRMFCIHICIKISTT